LERVKLGGPRTNAAGVSFTSRRGCIGELRRGLKRYWIVDSLFVGEASACPFAIVECDFVRQPRSGGLRPTEQRTGRSACATKGKRAGRMLGVTADKAHDEEGVVVATAFSLSGAQACTESERFSLGSALMALPAFCSAMRSS
jgi:hypothetical protein